MRQLKSWWQPLGACVMLAVLLVFLFYHDNKYQTPPPYGKSGVMNLNEKDLERNYPIFLN